MSIKDEKQIANIATRKGERLNNLKILGVFPLYLGYTETSVHIEICKLRCDLREVLGSNPDELIVSDSENFDKLSKAVPIFQEICTIGILNNSLFSIILKPFVLSSIKKLSFEDLFNLFIKVLSKSDHSFFLLMSHRAIQADQTLLKEAFLSPDL